MLCKVVQCLQVVGELSDREDRIAKPAGESGLYSAKYYAVPDDLLDESDDEKVLDWFHNTVPLGCVEDFEWEVVTYDDCNGTVGPAQGHWFSALRSGKYAQGHGQLFAAAIFNREVPCYCCLGVGCLIFGDKSPTGVALNGSRWVQRSLLGLHAADGRPVLTARTGYGNSDVLEYSESVLHVETGEKLFSCVHMNDKLGMSFSQIADHLEKHAIYYFSDAR